MQRSTRKVQLTEAGVSYLARCEHLLEVFNELDADLRKAQQIPSGRLRITAPVSGGEYFVVDSAMAFMKRYADIAVDLHFNDRVVNIVDEGFDLAIRLGELKDSNLVARQIGQASLVVCAAPEFLTQYGVPRTPGDLSSYPCVVDRSFRGGTRWPFVWNAKPVEVEVGGRIYVTGEGPTRQAVLAGMGVGFVFRHMIADELKRGQLIPLFKNTGQLSLPINLVYSHRQYLPAKIKMFIEFISNRMSSYGLTAPSSENSVAVVARKARSTR